MVQKKRRQVSFNIDDDLYTDFKKLMLDERTTPTADITRHIKERVEKDKEVNVKKLKLKKSDEVTKEENSFTILTNDLYEIEELNEKTFEIIRFYLKCAESNELLLANKEVINNSYELMKGSE